MEVKNSETIGLWSEKLICDVKNIPFNTTRKYISELHFEGQKNFTIQLTACLEELDIVSHIGNLNNFADFSLGDGSFLNVKTNISGDKICPNSVGQTTFRCINPDFKSVNDYKKWIFRETWQVLNFYLSALFKCKYTVYINFSKGFIFLINNEDINDIVFNNISFTKSLEDFNESCTMKHNGKCIAEFQCHNNRNVVKCRFAMINLLSFVKHKVIKFEQMVFKIRKTSASFNYIGSKTNLLSFIQNTVEAYIGTTVDQIPVFYDLFSGTGVVSNHLLSNGCKKVINNDLMLYGYVLSSTLTKANINIEKINNYMNILNNLTPFSGYIDKCYAETRMFFTRHNAQKIDSILNRINIDKALFNSKEHSFIMKCLILAVSKIANVSSTYGAFLKKFKAAALKNIVLVNNFTLNDGELVSYNTDTLIFVDNISFEYQSVCYLDPPYNSRRYSKNYFILESIVKNNQRPISDGITGLPLDTTTKEAFCNKSTVKQAFSTLFNKIQSRYLFMSYNSESLLTKEEIVKLLETNGWINVKVAETEYKKFKANANTKTIDIKEYLFCCEKLSLI